MHFNTRSFAYRCFTVMSHLFQTGKHFKNSLGTFRLGGTASTNRHRQTSSSLSWLSLPSPSTLLLLLSLAHLYSLLGCFCFFLFLLFFFFFFCYFFRYSNWQCLALTKWTSIKTCAYLCTRTFNIQYSSSTSAEHVLGLYLLMLEYCLESPCNGGIHTFTKFGIHIRFAANLFITIHSIKSIGYCGRMRQLSYYTIIYSLPPAAK